MKLFPQDNDSDNENINWSDPIFGVIPEEYQNDWYLMNSGTYWNNMKKMWFVRGLTKFPVMRRNRKTGEMVEVQALQAEVFQDQMVTMREFIQQSIVSNFYIVSHKNIFDLMTKGTTQVECRKDDETFYQEVKLPASLMIAND